MYNQNDFDRIDLNYPPTATEPERQYYFIAKCRQYVKERSTELGRPLSCCARTFGCPFV